MVDGSPWHSFLCREIKRKIRGPIITKVARIKSQTSKVKGAKSPDPVADSAGRLIKTTHSPTSRIGEYLIIFQYVGTTGRKAAAISASCLKKNTLLTFF